MMSRPVALSLMFLILVSGIVIPGCKSDPYRTKSFKNVFDHYREQEDIKAVSFPPGIVGIFLNESDPEQAEIKKLMQELSSFRMLILDGDLPTEASNNAGLASEMKATVVDFTNRNEFQDLFRMQFAGQDIFIRIQEEEGIVKEAILMLEADDSFFVINLRGNISLEHFTTLVEGGYLDGLIGLGELNL